MQKKYHEPHYELYIPITLIRIKTTTGLLFVLHMLHTNAVSTLYKS